MAHMYFMKAIRNSLHVLYESNMEHPQTEHLENIIQTIYVQLNKLSSFILVTLLYNFYSHLNVKYIFFK